MDLNPPYLNVKLTTTLEFPIDGANCKDTIWILNPKDVWTKTQKAQYNEFLENGLENWALTSQTINKVDIDNKKMKIDWFNLKKIVLSTVRGDYFLYIDSQVWLQVPLLITTVFFS